MLVLMFRSARFVNVLKVRSVDFIHIPLDLCTDVSLNEFLDTSILFRKPKFSLVCLIHYVKLAILNCVYESGNVPYYW